MNKVKFRKYWDAELRASVYLNEFLTQNAKWMDTLTSAIAPKYSRASAETRACSSGA